MVSDFNKVLPNILTLPAPFLRISPTLMPPSDDEVSYSILVIYGGEIVKYLWNALKF